MTRSNDGLDSAPTGWSSNARAAPASREAPGHGVRARLHVSVGAGPDRRGVLITGTSGAGKTTLVAGLLRHREFPVAVLNDDWGVVSLRSGHAVSTGEGMLHMKTASVLALRPGFYTSAPEGSY